GTTRPFEWVGAPYLDAHEYATALEGLRLPGATFRPARFVPTFHKWAGRVCGGVQLHVTDRATFKPFLAGLAVIAVARRLAPGRFRWKRPPYEFERRRLPIDILLGTDQIRRTLERGRPAARASVREQSREEVLHARAEGVRTLLDAAALEVLPRALGRRRGRLARLLEFLAGELRALDDGVADALGRLLHARTDLAVPDLLGAGLDLTRRRLHFRLIRGDDRRRRPADDGDRRERDRQQSLGV